MNRLLSFLLALGVAVAAAPAWAGPGHDHGDEAAPTAGAPSPRLTASSDLFELVGIVEGTTMTIYLDRATTNEPVTGATLELETAVGSGSTKLPVDARPDGTYVARADFLAQPGQYAFTVGVTAGADVDVLAGNLEIVAAAADHAHDAAWWPWALGSAAGIAAILVLLLRGRGRARTAAAALGALAVTMLLTGALALPQDALAGPGHDHGDAPAAAGGNSPRRLPDGHVFLPKPSQRQLAVRTALTEQAERPRTVTLMARVVADPNAGGKVQPTVAGRIEAGPRGLPNLGQRVTRGEVLAVVRTSAGGIERANQNAAIAELEVARDVAERRLARLKQLEGSVSQREIEAAQAEFDSASRRLGAVSARDARVEPLVAPVSGVISAANVVAGQVVDAREVVFEIVDPTRQRIEAVAFDAALAAGITGAHAAPATAQMLGASIPLQLVGAGRSQVDGGYPIQFVAVGKDLPPLTVGQPTRVFAQTAARVKGVPVPAAALVKSPSNADIVWVKDGPELFGPRVVRFEPVDGATVVVVSGLQPGERVVVQGAPLVNQVR